ncbi:MAG: hypothetical protein RLZZ546_2002 [Bacteroidota bacterium]|jgi:hypothetical protein
MKNKSISETVNWLQVEAEYHEMFSKLKNFANKNSFSIENIDKPNFNRFITESNFPIFLNIPEEFLFNTKNVETTFRGLNSFLHLNNKK